MVVLHITGDQLYADMLEHEPNADSCKPWERFSPEMQLLWHSLASLENRHAELRESVQSSAPKRPLVFK